MFFFCWTICKQYYEKLNEVQKEALGIRDTGNIRSSAYADVLQEIVAQEQSWTQIKKAQNTVVDEANAKLKAQQFIREQDIKIQKDRAKSFLFQKESQEKQRIARERLWREWREWLSLETTHKAVVPLVAILSPVFCFLIKQQIPEIGFELLIINGIITFGGLYLLKKKK